MHKFFPLKTLEIILSDPHVLSTRTYRSISMTKKEKKDWSQFKNEHGHELDGVEASDTPLDEEVAPQSSALDHPSYIELEEKLTLAEQKAHEHWEQSVRALAELENVRRRAEREVANAHRFGLEKIITSLLPVVDSIEQALQMAEKEAQPAMHEGLELTMKLFLDVLQKFEVEQLDPINEVFDPQQHEAMSMMEAANTPPNTVITVFQKGYKLNDRVIRPARVIVSKNK
jgi:molecular chaperone GrpE